MVTGIIIFVHVLLSILMIVLVLMHNPRDSGLGSVGGVSGTSGGQHVMERNLNRITVVVAVAYTMTTFMLHRFYS